MQVEKVKKSQVSRQLNAQIENSDFQIYSENHFVFEIKFNFNTTLFNDHDLKVFNYNSIFHVVFGFLYQKDNYF